jgi:transglutaminase-like putative cysteine protease
VASLVVVTIVASLVAVAFLGDSIPQDGVMSWRSPAGYTDGYSSSGSYNPYTDIRANLIAQSDNPLFTATITGDVDPTSVRFRMLTLDAFDGNRWKTDRIQAFPLDEEPWISEPQIYRGPTTSIAAQIRIENLSMPWLPTPVTATDATTADDSDYFALRTRRMDGSIYFPGDFTREGMEYAVTADIPTFSASDYADLARNEDGSLSPLFATAEEDGQVVLTPTAQLPPMDLDNAEYWTEYPEDLGARVVGEAREITRNMDTNFEKALALEAYFREDGGFVYNTSVPSDFTTDNVEDWLFDDTNEFTRNGYCEQFATTMALMARAVGLPSRVVLGFTGGTLVNDDTVLVADKNAHSWVEIWIPSHGWMAFDPTPRSTNATPTVDEQVNDAFGFSPAAYASLIPTGNLVDTSGGGEAFDNPTLQDRVTRDPAFAATGAGASDSGGLSLPGWALPVAVVLAGALLLATLAPFTKWIRRKRRARRLASGDISAAWEDITDRLTDLGDPFNPSATPVEAASAFDDAFVPLAKTYGDALYGEKVATAAVIDRATIAHERAEQHLTTRYSKTQRVLAAYRPTRFLNRIKRLNFTLKK